MIEPGPVSKHGKQMIEVINLNKSFPMAGREIRVLKGIDLRIGKGEMLSVVGASGVGKSTLLHILGTLDRPTSGKILFGELDLFTLSEQKLADFRNRRIGFVFQFHHLLPEFSALENVQMPALIQGSNPAEAGRRAREILKGVGLAERIHHRPGQLSGGEQQRVAVARALLLEPDLVLADEPTGNLDTHTSEEVFSLLRDLNKQKGITFIVVTHNERLAAQADRILKMVDGRIEEGQ
jgi:lipoprotein-releasing system ATP-binding protein